MTAPGQGTLGPLWGPGVLGPGAELSKKIERLRHTTIELQRQCAARTVVQQFLQEAAAFQSFPET